MPNLSITTLIIFITVILAGCNPFQKMRKTHKPLPKEQMIAYSLVVSAQYPNASNWAQYVKRSDLSSACTGSETGFSPCLHGGDKRKVVLTGINSCAGLSMTDSADAFYWRCDDSSSPATFYSALKENKTLSDLISNYGWKTITVTLHGGVHDGATSSALASWWSNEIVEAPLNASSCSPVANYVECEASGRAKLTHAGAVYVVSSTHETLGYKIAADNISFTTMPGKVLKTKLVANCTYQNDEATGPFPETCFLQTYNNKFLWVEGKFTMSEDPVGNASNVFGVYVKDTTLSTFRHIDSAVSDDAAFVVDSSASNNFSFIKVNSANVGLRVVDFSFTPRATEHNVYSNVFINGMSGNGLSVNLGGKSIFTTMTIANTDGAINHQANTNHVVYHNVMMANNKTSGLSVVTSNNLTAGQFASFYTDLGLSMNAVTTSTVNGNFMFGNNTTSNCSITGQAPLVNTVCANNVANNVTSPPEATAITNVDVANSFVGLVTTKNFPTTADWILNDWINPSQMFYSWNKAGTFLAPTTSGYCDSAQTDCHLYNYSLSSADTELLNKSDDGANANEAFAVGANCPSAVLGNKKITNSDASVVYLKNAIEIDGVGNGNGLCESGETCLYTPNFGAYQGHGKFGKCTFSNGSISNVMMFGYESNGY